MSDTTETNDLLDLLQATLYQIRAEHPALWARLWERVAPDLERLLVSELAPEELRLTVEDVLAQLDFDEHAAETLRRKALEIGIDVDPTVSPRVAPQEFADVEAPAQGVGCVVRRIHEFFFKNTVVVPVVTDVLAAATTIEFIPKIAVPESVVLRQPFEMIVGISPRMGDDGFEVDLKGTDAALVEITLAIEPPEHAEIVGATSAVLKIRADLVAAPVVFHIDPRCLGVFEVTVVFRSNAGVIGHARESVDVVQRVAERQPRRLTIRPPARLTTVHVRADRADMTLLVMPQSNHGYQFWLQGGDTHIVESRNYTVDPVEHIARSFMDASVKFFYPRASAPPEDGLAIATEYGARLARDLLPPAILRGLAKLESGASLHVLSEGMWAPWELLWIPRKFGPGFFLGTEFAVGVGLLGLPFQLQIRSRPGVFAWDRRFHRQTWEPNHQCYSEWLA
jgi:hypothetical protein